MLRWELVASGALAGLCAAMVVELCSFGLQWWWEGRSGSSTGPSGLHSPCLGPCW